jgi:hypothetical protein
VALVLILVPLLVAEGGVRLLVATNRLPVAAAHLGNVEYAWANLARRGPTDVILFGDSMTQQGIDPKALADDLEPLIGHRPSTFTLASPGGGFGVNMALAQQLAREGRLPKVAVIGVSYSSIETDGTFRDAFAPSPMGQLFTDCSRETGLDNVVACKASELSMLWRWRGRVKRVFSAVLHPLKTTNTRAAGGFVIRADGFREGKPSTVAEIQAQIPQALADYPPALTIGPGVEDSFVQLVRTLVEGGTTVVAIGVPVSPVYQAALATSRPDWEAQRLAAVTSLSAAASIPIVDPVSLGSWWGDGSSRDVNHLSRDGAPAFVGQLMTLPGFRDPIVARLSSGK